MRTARDRLVWWVDRCLGSRIVPDALRGIGAKVETYADLYPHDDAVPDVEWIPEVTRRGWIILTKDREIRRAPAELAVLRAAGARYVCLSATGLRGDEQAACLVERWKTVEGVVEARSPPLVVAITRGGVKWLDDEGAWRAVKAKRDR